MNFCFVCAGASADPSFLRVPQLEFLPRRCSDAEFSFVGDYCGCSARSAAGRIPRFGFDECGRLPNSFKINRPFGNCTCKGGDFEDR